MLKKDRIAATTSKKRFGNHKKKFNHKQRSKNGELSKYMWSLKKCENIMNYLLNAKYLQFDLLKQRVYFRYL